MKKGFTLIELLAVIAVLAVVLTIGTGSITKILKEKRQDMYNTQIESFKGSVKMWMYDNTNLLPEEGKEIRVTFADLINAGVMEDGIINPLTKEPYDIEEESFYIYNDHGNYSISYDGESLSYSKN